MLTEELAEKKNKRPVSMSASTTKKKETIKRRKNKRATGFSKKKRATEQAKDGRTCPIARANLLPVNQFL